MIVTLLAPLLVVLGLAAGPDWLLDAQPYAARAEVLQGGKEISLSNGLVRRVWRLGPNAATIALENMANGRSEVRSVRPEASVTIDGAAYAVGGLVGQPIHNYLLPEWIDAMTADPGAFTFAGHRIGKTKERFAWKPRPEWISSKVQWPPAGVSLEDWLEL